MLFWRPAYQDRIGNSASLLAPWPFCCLVHPGALAPHWFAAAIATQTAATPAVVAQLAALPVRVDNERIHRQDHHVFHTSLEMPNNNDTGL